jgi:AcrR family transcriptional regulator
MTEYLHALPTIDLMSISLAIRAGRLSLPLTEVSLKRFVTITDTLLLQETLARCVSDGLALRHLALILEAIANARKDTPRIEELIELVWSGPEVASLPNRDTGVVVREMFNDASSDILMAGFAIYQGKEIFQRLAERMDQQPNLRVRFFVDIQRKLGDTTREQELIDQFFVRFARLEWPGKRLPELFFDPRSLSMVQTVRSSLHAKCIVVDRSKAFVTSANFTAAAQERNIEVGVLVRSPGFAEKLVEHFETLLQAGLLIPVRA